MSQTTAAASTTDPSLSQDIQRDVDDILSALRSVHRSGRAVAEAGGNALERELRMAIRLSEEIRDSVISPAALSEAREQEFYARMRADAHRIVDLVADFGTVAALQVSHFADGMLSTSGQHPAALSPAPAPAESATPAESAAPADDESA